MYGKVEVTPCGKCGASERGSQGQCKPCRATWQREWYAKCGGAKAASKKWAGANRSAVVSNARRHHLKKYGLTPDSYAALLAAQSGACAICRSTQPTGPGGKNFMVDHDHKTGIVRGLLCSHCNSMLGHAKDNGDVLASAIEYLRPKKGG